MANANKPFGLRPKQTLGGGGTTGQIKTFLVPATDATAIYIGDPVKLAGSSATFGDSDAIFPTVTKAATTEAVVGVVVAIMPDYSDLEVNYRVASTAMLVRVAVDPDQVFEIQGDADTWDAADVGLNMSLTVSTGSATTGVSNAVADQSTAAVTATLFMQVLGVSNVIGNDVTGGYPLILVKLNNHQYSNATTGL